MNKFTTRFFSYSFVLMTQEILTAYFVTFIFSKINMHNAVCLLFFKVTTWFLRIIHMVFVFFSTVISFNEVKQNVLQKEMFVLKSFVKRLGVDILVNDSICMCHASLLWCISVCQHHHVDLCKSQMSIINSHVDIIHLEFSCQWYVTGISAVENRLPKEKKVEKQK